MIIDQLQEIFRDILNDDALVLTDETVAADLPGWDSLAHVNTLFAVEETYGVQFSTREFQRIRTIGELTESLAEKGASD
jgi:acyl carrier protein